MNSKKKNKKKKFTIHIWFSYFGTYPTTINTQSILNTVIIKYEWKQVNLTKVYRKESCRKMCTNNNISCIKTFIDKEMITYLKKHCSVDVSCRHSANQKSWHKDYPTNTSTCRRIICLSIMMWSTLTYQPIVYPLPPSCRSMHTQEARVN